MKAGTIYNAVKMTQMENQWQKKQQDLNGKKDKKDKNKELTVEEKQLQRYEEDLAQMRESNKKSYISNKLMSGGELTAGEIEYLKRNAPELLKEYEEIEQGKEAYRKQLKGCKSKEDVEKLKTTKMGEFMAQTKKIASNPNIPKSKKIGLLEKIMKKMAVIQKEHQKFVKSLAYKSLPEKTEHKSEDNSEPTAAVPAMESDVIRQDEIDAEGSEEQQDDELIIESMEKIKIRD